MIQLVSPTAAPTQPAAQPNRPQSPFHTFLSELNPLQYLPVVGTIYRAATGDTIPEAARIAGSSVVSFLTGGPVGLAISLGTTLVEKAAGIDPERMGQHVLASLGLGRTTAKPTPASPAPQQAAAQPWSQAQLASYGIDRTAQGDCRCGAMVGADVLNTLELNRLRILA
jgi:hypothetical protein